MELSERILKPIKSRPINLDLTTISLPLPAIASIAHRVSGVISLFTIGCLLWFLDLSLASADGFSTAQGVLNHPIVFLLLWGMLSLLGYHLVAGIRHLVMDAGYGEELETGRKSAKWCFIVAGVLSIFWGILLW